MARPKKRTVDYFPHIIKQGKTITILENRFGNDGYAFWFKLLEILGSTDGHSYRFENTTEKEFLYARTKVSSEKSEKILNLLADLNAIDPELWKNNIIWSDNFIEHIEDVYNKRRTGLPKKPVIDNINPTDKEFSEQKPSNERVNNSRNPQSKLKETKEKESKPKEKKSEKKNRFLYQNYESLDYKHQKFAVRFIVYLKKEFPNYWEGLLKRYKNKRICIRTTLENYLDTLDKLIRLDNYTWEQIITACRFAINDDDNSGGFCWKDQFKSLCKLRESKGDKPKYISRWLSKANQQKRTKKTLASKVRDWGKQQRS